MSATDASYMQHGGGGIRLRKAITSLMSQARVDATRAAGSKLLHLRTSAVIRLISGNNQPWDSSVQQGGSVNMARVAPPSTNSRMREWP
jgi:hypothetical protein